MAYAKGRDILYTYHRPLAKTANYTATASDCSKTINNRGATGPITITLPDIAAVSPGWWIKVAVKESQQITIATASGQLMTTGNTGSSQVTNNVVASVYEIEADPDDGNFLGIPQHGTWTAS